jgi:DNA mismatch repair protein MutS
MPFTRILVAIDGSPGGQKALATAIELASLTGAMLTALAVEGKLPAYAATIGEVDEVRRRKDEFFEQLARAAREQADAAGVDLEVDVRPGHAARVRVARYEGESDYSAEIERTFSKFEQGATKSYLVELPEGGGLDHVEARILERVARLYPDLFARLAAYRERHGGFLDGTIVVFDREVQFYVAYLEYVDRLRTAGLPFSYPRVSGRSKDVFARDAFDLALAGRLVPEGSPVVCNDFRVESPERILVVTGPNQGGKTTFARMFGQLHYLASLGVPVPARAASLFLPDRIFTHFEREEDLATLRGKLEDELVRIREIIRETTSDSVVVINESFGSTTLATHCSWAPRSSAG